jgi:biotin operon repressor
MSPVYHHSSKLSWLYLVHHVRKGSDNDDDWLESVSGSFGLTGAADSIWTLARGRGTRQAIFRVTGRDIEEASWAIEQDPLTMGWIIKGRADEFTSEARQAVISLLQTRGPLGAKALADELGKSRPTIAKMLKALVDQGIVENDRRGRYRYQSNSSSMATQATPQENGWPYPESSLSEKMDGYSVSLTAASASGQSSLSSITDESHPPIVVCGLHGETPAIEYAPGTFICKRCLGEEESEDPPNTQMELGN